MNQLKCIVEHALAYEDEQSPVFDFDLTPVQYFDIQ